jgi:RIO kinase 2
MARELETYMKEVGADGDAGAARDDLDDEEDDDDEEGSEEEEEDEEQEQAGQSSADVDESSKRLETLQVSESSGQ